RKQGWAQLVEACKIIAGKTILLLQIVYGAELQRIFTAAEMTIQSVEKLDGERAKDSPDQLAEDASNAASMATQLAEYVKSKAADTDSPLLKQQLQDRSEELEAKSEALISAVNDVLADPD